MKEAATTTATVDATGLLCPEPVMMLHAAVRKLAPGESVLLLATDPSTQRDVPSFCRFLEHELLSQQSDNGRFEYVIRKSGN